ncbi:MAG: TetR/AcrR family transcriptional regulator [Gemmatimonadota bacterium]
MTEARRACDEKFTRILQTAAAIFADKGYHDTSIRDISRATGVSLSGLYYYFRSKEELLFLIMDHCFGTVLENAREVLAGETDATRRLRLFIQNHLSYFVSNMKEMKVLSHEADSLTGDYRRLVNTKKRQYTDLCIRILTDLGPPESIDPRIAAYTLFGMMNWIYNWYRPERDVPVAELADNMSQLFLHGYLTGAAPAPSRAAQMKRSPSIWRT